MTKAIQQQARGGISFQLILRKLFRQRKLGEVSVRAQKNFFFRLDINFACKLQKLFEEIIVILRNNIAKDRVVRAKLTIFQV